MLSVCMQQLVLSMNAQCVGAATGAEVECWRYFSITVVPLHYAADVDSVAGMRDALFKVMDICNTVTTYSIHTYIYIYIYIYIQVVCVCGVVVVDGDGRI